MKRLVGLLLLMLGPLAPLLWFDTAAGLRWSGMAYELAGLFTVVWGVNAKPTAVGLPLVALTAWQSVKDKAVLVFSKPRTSDATGRVEGVAGVGGVGDFSFSTTNQTPTIEGQLAELKQRVGRIEEDLSKTGDRLRALDAETTQRLGQERSERDKADADLRGQVRATALGDKSVELAGVILFAVGVVLSSVAGSF